MNILTAIWSWLSSGAGIWSAGGVAVLILSYIMKKYVGKELWDKIGVGVESLFFVLFSAVTIFMNKLTKGVWNKIIEPPFQILIGVVFENALKGTIRGLDSDDEPN